jgi:AcrR family transcriptional regulator
MEDESTRERLIAAGVELLERDGMAGVGLRAITRHVGVSHGAPRRYFPTHAALLAGIAATGIADLDSRLSPVLATPGALVEMGVRYVDFAVERPEMFALMFRHDLLENSGENLRATTLPIFTSFANLVRHTNPHTDPLAIFATIHGIAALAANRAMHVFGTGVDLRRLVEHSIRQQLTAGV